MFGGREQQLVCWSVSLSSTVVFRLITIGEAINRHWNAFLIGKTVLCKYLRQAWSTTTMHSRKCLIIIDNKQWNIMKIKER